MFPWLIYKYRLLRNTIIQVLIYHQKNLTLHFDFTVMLLMGFRGYHRQKNLIQLEGLGESCKLPQRVFAEPSRWMIFAAFWAEKRLLMRAISRAYSQKIPANLTAVWIEVRGSWRLLHYINRLTYWLELVHRQNLSLSPITNATHSCAPKQEEAVASCCLLLATPMPPYAHSCPTTLNDHLLPMSSCAVLCTTVVHNDMHAHMNSFCY